MGLYSLGDQTFTSFKKIHEHCQALLRMGNRTLNESEKRFILDLLSYHPLGALKLGKDIESIKVDDPIYGAGSCYIIVYKDGEKDPFSYKKCSLSAKENPKQAIKQDLRNQRVKAYRQAIETQISDYWHSCRPHIRCVKCGTTESVQIDHKSPSFVEIINEFEQSSKPKKYPNIIRVKDSIFTFQFDTTSQIDLLYTLRWKCVHKYKATYQLLCNDCNVEKSSPVCYRPYLEEDIAA